VQYKNAQFHEAAQNFSKSIKKIQVLIDCLSASQNSFENMLELEYYYRVRAHRVYQYAMSRYKLMRYAPDNVRDKKMNWQLVDYELRQALEKYNEIRVHETNQPMFMDLIIKITVNIEIKITFS